MKRKISPYNFIIGLSTVVLILLTSVLFGYSFVNKGLIVASSARIGFSYYCVEVGKFQEFAEAQSKANEVMEKGGAGYIFYDKGFRVFVSCYLSNNDAQSVAIKNDSASVYELKIKPFEFSVNSSQNINQIFKNNLLTFKNCITTLNSLIIDYQQKKINEATVRTNCILLAEEIDMQIEKFNNIFYESAKMYRYKNLINSFKDCFSKIVSFDISGVDFVRTINYQQISAVVTLRNILLAM